MCEFGCKYCDSSFSDTVIILNNAVEILEKEIVTIPKGMIIIGSVHEPYQEIEKEYNLIRNILKTIQEYNFNCHILTKSNNILRDIDILKKIKGSIVTLSIISLQKRITNIFEQGAPTPLLRLKTVKKLVKCNIKSGIALIPMFPYIVDEELEYIIKTVKTFKANYFLTKILELKGDQKLEILELIRKEFPKEYKKYKKYYTEIYLSDQSYIDKITKIINDYCMRYDLKNRISI
jgi:DNA repair photolyase